MLYPVNTSLFPPPQHLKVIQSLLLGAKMEHRGLQLNQSNFSCSICLDLLKDPVTIPCGHSYCMDCIKCYWDGKDQRKIHSCPQCRKEFIPRPALEKSIMLAALVEDLKKTGLQADHCASKDDRMKIYCRMEEHKGHETVPAAAERAEKKKELQESRQQIHQRIQDQEKDVKLLQQEVEAINRSADKTVKDSEKIFTQLIRLLQKRSSEVKQQIRSQQKTEVSRVKDVQEKLEQEITELKRKDAELEQLSHTEDHTQFLLNYPSLPALRESTHSSSINIRPLRHFEDVTAAVTELKEIVLDVLRDTWTNISLKVTGVDVLLAEPKTRDGFLHHSKEITLDPNTANRNLFLSEGNRKVIRMMQQQFYLDNPDRFTDYKQVLSRESLTGRCYWEVEWTGRGVGVAVSYQNIRRSEGFGFNDKSWSLYCTKDGNTFFLDDIETPVPGPVSSRIGVYLDHRAGILSFYSVSGTMTLLHRVQTRFTQPLYAGICVYNGSSAELIKPQQSV
ncbi:tripartite motif-containing protein 16-like protein [Poecilia latipinna]|uniref:tripartite motif-containing protein 16-like protein n=1 Tax=Poecilia latipinna TaxID=48699 RepID=UPI00072D9BD8|nr:PREDICTED: tripartite motif-containing protein 16-like protein [Poecilia latipinna]